MKKVLIIGGSGFIGVNLTRRLLQETDYEVYSFDKANPVFLQSSVHYITGDFFDDVTLRNIIDDMDYIVHAISTINPGNSNDMYLQGYQKDLIQTIKLCEYLIGKDSKLIFLSSGGTVYGNHNQQPIDEECLPKPINHYGNIKLSIENALRTFNYQMKNRMMIVRISNPYGNGQDYSKGVGFIDAVLKKSMKNMPIEIWGDGNNIRDYIYIDDVCDMLIDLFEYDGEYDTFNISSGIGTTQNEIIEIVRKMGYKPEVIYTESRTVDVRAIVLDNTRIMKIYNRKITSIEEGIKIYAEMLHSGND